MSVKHLIQSIVQEADRRISDADKAHAERMANLEAKHETKLDSIRKGAQDRLAERKRSLRNKAESLGRISASKLLLSTKNKEINAVYDAVLSGLESLPEKELSAFFQSCLEMAGMDGGTIRAAAKHEAMLKKLAGKNFEMGETLPKASGGFTLSSDTREWNFTFDFLVSQSLRPVTEIDAATSLFA